MGSSQHEVTDDIEVNLEAPVISQHKIISIPPTVQDQMLSFNGNRGECFSHISNVKEITFWSNPIFDNAIGRKNLIWHNQEKSASLPSVEPVREELSQRQEYDTEMIVSEFESKCEALIFVFRQVQSYSDGLEHYPDELYRTRSDLPSYLVASNSHEVLPTNMSDDESNKSTAIITPRVEKQ